MLQDEVPHLVNAELLKFAERISNSDSASAVPNSELAVAAS